MNWITPSPCTDRLQEKLGELFKNAEFRWPDFFPNLRTDSSLVIAADYAGEHQVSKYDVIAFLLADRPGILNSWEQERLSIRKQHLSDGRRHAFKDLSDARRQKALVPFLNASSKINGIIFCVAIDKSLRASNFGYQFTENSSLKPAVLAKLTRVAIFGSILVGGLGRAGQDLMWITDEDEIVGNERIQQDAGAVIGAILHRCCPFGLTGVDIGIAGKFDDDRRAEDLCAIADLVGGALAEHLTMLDKRAIPRSTNIVTTVFKHSSTKAKIILSWFAMLQGALKRVVCLVRPHESGGLLISFTNPEVRVPGDISSQLWLPPDKGWINSSRAWKH